MTAAQALIDLSTQLTVVVKSINALVDKQPLPFDAPTIKLANAAEQLAAQANVIGQAGLSALASDVQSAVAQLSNQVAAANSAMCRIGDLKQALNLAGTLLTCAAGIAAGTSAGNWIGAAAAVITLSDTLQSAITALAAVPRPPANTAAPAAASAPTTSRKRRKPR